MVTLCFAFSSKQQPHGIFIESNTNEFEIANQNFETGLTIVLKGLASLSLSCKPGG